MKLIEEGSFGDSIKKCVSLVRYILGLDSMDTMVIGFKEIGTVYTLVTNFHNVSVE